MYQVKQGTAISNMQENDCLADPVAGFSHHYKLFYQPLRAFAWKLLGDPLTAEDVVAEVFIKLWRRYEDFSTDIRVKAFLYISTRNACINHLKQARRRLVAFRKYIYIAEQHSGSRLDEIIYEETLEQAVEVVQSLPPKCRAIILHVFYGGKKSREIAELMNISFHTVRNQRRRASELMAERLLIIAYS